MTDIAITDNNDIQIETPDLLTGDDLRTAIRMSILTNARAADDDVVPGNSRGGHFSDSFSLIPEDKIGSKLWLLKRSKIVPETLLRAKEYAQDALNWLITDALATNIDVTPFVSNGTLMLDITIKLTNAAMQKYIFKLE